MNYPWESCITICKQWAWKPNDKMKSVQESIQTLVATAAGNGNLLYNVGPMMDGRMEDRQIKLLATLGVWLKKNGESIYATKGGPYKPNKDWAATRKNNKVFIHVFKKIGNSMQLPPIPNIEIKKAYFLNGSALTYKQDANGLLIDLPADLSDENDTVIVLELNKDAEGIPLIENVK